MHKWEYQVHESQNSPFFMVNLKNGFSWLALHLQCIIMGTTTVSHPGNWLSEEIWGLFLSKMSCSAIDQFTFHQLAPSGMFVSKMNWEGHYQSLQMGWLCWVMIGILDMYTPAQPGVGSMGKIMSPCLSGEEQTEGGFCEGSHYHTAFKLHTIINYLNNSP